MVYDPRPKISMTVEQSPWQSFFESIPDTVLAFHQLNMQLEQQQINRDYQAAREDLRFARQDYLQAKQREDSWRDTLSKAGYSTEHITGPGSDLMSSTTEDILTATKSTEQTISKLQTLSAELGQWAKKGLEWEKKYASLEDETRENEYRNLVLEGGAFLYTEADKKAGDIPEGKKVGDVYGTGEFAEALKGLTAIELEQLKDINVRTAVSEKLRSDATAIKDWSALMAGQKTASEIGQKQSGVMWQNIIRTADKYSGRENITVTQSDLLKYNEYQDEAGNLTLEGQNLELQKIAIGREYEYLVMGNYMDLPEDASEEELLAQQRRHLRSYNTMASDFDVAKPTAGGYGKSGAPGNQIRLKETIAAAYNNYQNIIAGGDKDEVAMFSSKALKYLGVNFNDPALIEELGLQSTLDRSEVNDEILANLDYIDRLDKGTLGPMYWDPEYNEEPTLGPPIPEGGLTVPDEDVSSSYYQQGKDYYDKATEAVWGPEIASVVEAIPLYQAGRAVTSGIGTGIKYEADAINRALFELGSTAINVGAVPLNQIVKAVSGYSPGISGERIMEGFDWESGLTALGKRPESITDPAYSLGTYTPEGGFWTGEMEAALGQLEATDKQLSKKPAFKYTSQKSRRAKAKAAADSLAAIDEQAILDKAVMDLKSEVEAVPKGKELMTIFLSSEHLRSLGSFAEILDEWKTHVAEEQYFGRSPDIGEWLLVAFPGIEADSFLSY